MQHSARYSMAFYLAQGGRGGFAPPNDGFGFLLRRDEASSAP